MYRVSSIMVALILSLIHVIISSAFQMKQQITLTQKSQMMHQKLQRTRFLTNDANSANEREEIPDDQRRQSLIRLSKNILILTASNAVAPFSRAVAMSNVLPLQQPREAYSSDQEDIFGTTEEERTVVVPLEYNERLDSYLLCYTVGGQQYTAILDTGSPFLLVPGSCNIERVFGNRADIWGCAFRAEDSRPTDLEDTIEGYNNNEGRVVWRKGDFAFLNATGNMLMMPSANQSDEEKHKNEFIFGVLADSGLVGGLGGGVFFGLADTRYFRPSFLSQTNIKAFSLDLRSPASRKKLTLTTNKSFVKGDYIPLVSDLNRRYKDPTYHYTARALSFKANGSIIGTRTKKRIYVIFDTGVSGMLVSRQLYEERYSMARDRREKSLWGTVEISFLNNRREPVSVTATKPITTPAGKIPWPGFNDHLVVIGLAFLEGHIMTVDINERRLRID